MDIINDRFGVHGWRCIKALSDLDEECLMEDLAQYERDEIIVDFGFYRGSVETESSAFIIFIIAGGDWENYLAKLRFSRIDLALQFLQLLPAVTFAPDMFRNRPALEP